MTKVVPNEWEKFILETWDAFLEIEPNISTERLFAIVEDTTGRDVGVISEPLTTCSCSG